MVQPAKQAKSCELRDDMGAHALHWCDLPRDLPPYSTVFWHYKQWRKDGVIEDIMFQLHGQVREKAQKKVSGQP